MNRDDITLITAIGGLAFGFLGAALGMINTWRTFNRDRVRVRVRPVWLISNDHTGFGIEVTNLSYFAITITELGFTVRGARERITFRPGTVRGCELPERMEPRTSFTARLPMGAAEEKQWATIGRAYVATACGSLFTGTSGALRERIADSHAARE